MRIRIANLLDGSAGTLVVAGSLTLPALVCAQTASYPTMDKPIAVAHGADEKKPLQQIARSARVLEMKVELAWLADPVTSPYRLEARLVGSTLEVWGEVLDEAVLGHAVRVARAECGMPVVSRVHLNPGLRAPSGGKPQEVLHREAFHALERAFPAQAPSITISTLPDGELVLKGTVPTYEDKLAISRHLRQATTCSCIMNQLYVLAEPQETRLSNSRKAPATLLAPAPLMPPSVQPAAHEVPAESVALGSPSPAPQKASPLGSAQSSSSKSSGSAKLPDGHAGPDAQAQTPAKSADKPIVYATKWRRLERSDLVSPAKAVPTAVSKVAVRSKDTASSSPQGDSPPSSKQHIYLRVLPSSNEAPAGVGQIASPPSASLGSGAPAKKETAAVGSLPPPPTPPLVASPTLTPGKPPIALTATAKAPPLSAPVGRNTTNPAKQEPYVTDGVILVESMIKPASHTASAAGAKPPPIVKTGPYVTSGMILVSDPAKEKAKPVNPALAALQTRLQERIAAVCGKPSTDVEVTAVTETNVAVRVKANSTLEGEEFSNRIFQLPELGPCQVSLDVLVMK